MCSDSVLKNNAEKEKDRTEAEIGENLRSSIGLSPNTFRSVELSVRPRYSKIRDCEKLIENSR